VVLGIDPAGGVDRGALEVGGDVVLGADAIGQDVELQGAGDPDDPICS
jgi:hypothetical protein